MSKIRGRYPPQGLIGMQIHDHDGPWHTSIPHGSRVINNYAHSLFRSFVPDTVFALSGRVFLTPIVVPFRCTIDRLGYYIGTVAGGNARIGLYETGSLGHPDLPDAGALIVETGSLAKPGTLRVHVATIADTQLDPGQYFFAVQTDQAADTFLELLGVVWHHNVDGLVSLGRSYDRGGGYGAFTDPCPVTAGSNFTPGLLRVKSVP